MDQQQQSAHCTFSCKGAAVSPPAARSANKPRQHWAHSSRQHTAPPHCNTPPRRTNTALLGSHQPSPAPHTQTAPAPHPPTAAAWCSTPSPGSCSAGTAPPRSRAPAAGRGQQAHADVQQAQGMTAQHEAQHADHGGWRPHPVPQRLLKLQLLLGLDLRHKRSGSRSICGYCRNAEGMRLLCSYVAFVPLL